MTSALLVLIGLPAGILALALVLFWLLEEENEAVS